jgi:type IV pilus assembly protein PilA
MKNIMNKIRKANKGFTLVELIIVIAIIAILTAVAAPQYIKYVDKGRWSKDQNEAASLLTVVQAAVVDANSNDTIDDITGAEGGTKVLDFTASGITVVEAYAALEDDIEDALGGDFDAHVNKAIVVTNKHSYEPAASSTTYTIKVDNTGAVTGGWA